MYGPWGRDAALQGVRGGCSAPGEVIRLFCFADLVPEPAEVGNTSSTPVRTSNNRRWRVHDTRSTLFQKRISYITIPVAPAADVGIFIVIVLRGSCAIAFLQTLAVWAFGLLSASHGRPRFCAATSTLLLLYHGVKACQVRMSYLFCCMPSRQASASALVHTPFIVLSMNFGCLSLRDVRCMHVLVM